MARGDARDVGEILIVDDTPENLVAIEAAMRGLEFDLVLANSGKEALRFLLEREFALVLLDVQMPNMDGLETAQMIRARPRTRHVPIIFVTAYDSNDDDVLAAYRLGAVDFLFKPIDSEILRAKASVFVELQRRTAEVARQALLIKQHEEAVRERALVEQRRRIEAEALRNSLLEQRAHSQELTSKNRELENIRIELENSNARLAEADRRKNEFIALLSHELRNPLAAVRTGIELLSGAPSGEELERLRILLDRQCTHLVRLVDDLLDISRVTSGKLNLRKELVRIDAILSAALELVTPEADGNGHEIRVDSQCGDTTVLGDPVRLAQIVGNLLSNAVRYSDEPGAIEVVARCQDGHVSILVRDHGRGIPEELVDRVFDMFVQEESSGEGLGLGLTLVRELTEKHGGTVVARSQGLGSGSEFEVRLPVSTNARADDSSAGKVVQDASFEPRNIVLIDDHDDLRELACVMLEHEGHTVREARTGEQGLTLILAEPPDVAIIDIGLPDMPGFTVARELRSQLGDDCPRLIALSGFSREEDRARALESGFDTHLSKPASNSALRAAMFHTEPASE